MRKKNQQGNQHQPGKKSMYFEHTEKKIMKVWKFPEDANNRFI